jgi:hypothetical protein
VAESRLRHDEAFFQESTDFGALRPLAHRVRVLKSAECPEDDDRQSFPNVAKTPLVRQLRLDIFIIKVFNMGVLKIDFRACSELSL